MTLQLANSTTRYGLVARSLHWTSVALLLTLIVTGSGTEGIADGPERTALIRQHASWGVLLLLVMLVRLAWRIRNPNPVQSYSLPAWRKTAARCLHWSIYLLVITQCLVGVGNLLADGLGIPLFGLFQTPPLAAADARLHGQLVDVHAFIYYMIFPLFAVHITAALLHQIFGVRDEEQPR